MKKTFTLCLLTMAIALTAQNIKVTWADTSGNREYGDFLGQNNKSYFYDESDTDETLRVKEFSKDDLALSNTCVFPTRIEKEGDRDLWKVIVVKDKLYYVERVYYSGEKRYCMYASLINKNGTLANRVLLDEKKGKRNKNWAGFFLRVVDDDSRILVYQEVKSEADKLEIIYSLYDEQLAKIASQVVRTPYSTKSELPHDNAVKGDYVYFFGRNLEDEGQKLKKQKLFCCNLKSGKLTEYIMPNDSILCHHFELRFTRNGEPVLAGLFAASIDGGKLHLITNRSEYFNGGFAVIFSPGLEKVLRQDFRLLYEAFNPKNDGVSVKNIAYVIKSIQVFDDSSIGIATEQQDVSSSDGGYRNYGYGSLFVFNVATKPANYWVCQAAKVHTGSGRSSSQLNKEDDSAYLSELFYNTPNSMNFYINSKGSEVPTGRTETQVQVANFGQHSGTQKLNTWFVTISSHGIMKVKPFQEQTPVLTNALNADLKDKGLLFGKLEKGYEKKYGKIEMGHVVRFGKLTIE